MKIMKHELPKNPDSLLRECQTIYTPWECGFLSGIGNVTELSDKQTAIYFGLLRRADFYLFAKNNGWKE